MARYEELSVTKLVAGDVEFVVGAEAANIINVAVQSAGRRAESLDFYLSDDVDGLVPTAAAPDGGIAIGTDGALIELTANENGKIITDLDGNADIDITDTTGTPTWYLVVVLPGGDLAISPAITFA